MYMQCFKVQPSTGAIGKVTCTLHTNLKYPFYTVDNNQIEIDLPVRIQVNTTRFTVTLNADTIISIDIKQYERFNKHRKNSGVSCVKKPDRSTLDLLKELSVGKSMAECASLNEEDDLIVLIDKQRKYIQLYNKQKQFIFHDNLKNGKSLQKEKLFFFSGHRLIPWTGPGYENLKSLIINSRKKQILNNCHSQTELQRQKIVFEQKNGQVPLQMIQQRIVPIERDKIDKQRSIVVQSRMARQKSGEKAQYERREILFDRQVEANRERSRQKPTFQRQRPITHQQQEQRLQARKIGRSNERIPLNRSIIKSSQMQQAEKQKQVQRKTSLQKSLFEKSQEKRKNNERQQKKSQRKPIYQQEQIQEDIFEEQESEERIYKRRLFQDSEMLPRRKRDFSEYEKGKSAENTGLKSLMQMNERGNQKTAPKSKRIRKQTKIGLKKTQQRFPTLSKIRARGAKLNQNVRVFKNVLDEICNRAYKSYINNAYTNQLCVLTPTSVIDVRQLGDSQYLFINQFKLENQTVTEPPIQLKYLNSAKQLITIRASKMIYNQETYSLFFNDKYLHCLHRFSFLGKFFQYIPLEKVAIDIENGKSSILGIYENEIFEYDLRRKNVFWGQESCSSLQKIVRTANGFLVATNKGVVSLFESHKKVKQFKVTEGVKQLKMNNNNEFMICKYQNNKTIIYQIRKEQNYKESRATQIFRSHKLKLADFSFNSASREQIIGVEEDERYNKLFFIVKNILSNQNVHSQTLDIEKGENANFVKYLDDLVIYGVDGVYQAKLLHSQQRGQRDTS